MYRWATLGDLRLIRWSGIPQWATMVLWLFSMTSPHHVRPADVVRRGNEWFVDAAADLIAEAAQKNVKVLGLDGFLVGDTGIYPALSRIADFSDDTLDVANRKALALLAGEWANAPDGDDQMHGEATGRYMLSVVLEG